MKTVILLDFEEGKVIILHHVKNIELKQGEEDWIRTMGYDPSNCQWMIVKDEDFNLVIR